MNPIQFLAALMVAHESVLLVGPPGCAKTAFIFAAAQMAGFKAIVSRAGTAERIDYSGCLVPDFKEGVTKALPLELIKFLTETKENIILFLDDLGQAPTDVQAALMQLFDSNKLGPNVLIWGATNRVGDAAGVTKLCEPLRSRFSQAFAIATPDSKETPGGAVYLSDWKGQREAWEDWAMSNGMPGVVIAYHRFTNGEQLYDWHPSADMSQRMADFRSWHTVGRLWNNGLRDIKYLAGAIGYAKASAFLSWTSYEKELTPPVEILKNPTTAIVPEEPSALFLVACNVALAVENKTAAAMLTYSERLPRLYGALMVRDAHKRLGKSLGDNPAWRTWYLKNKELFAGQ